MANHICITSLGFSLICALLCWLISPALVTWLGARGVVYEYGLTYLRIVVLDMPFLFMINLFTAVKQAQGDTVKPMLLNLLGIMINLILDPLFPHCVPLWNRRRSICHAYSKKSPALSLD